MSKLKHKWIIIPSTEQQRSNVSVRYTRSIPGLEYLLDVSATPCGRRLMARRYRTRCTFGGYVRAGVVIVVEIKFTLELTSTYSTLYSATQNNVGERDTGHCKLAQLLLLSSHLVM